MSDFEYINSSGKEVLKYVPPDSIIIDLHFILTQSRMLTRNMPYMLLEKRISGNHVAAIRLLEFHKKDGILSLSVQEIESKKKYILSANMDYEGDMWMWSLADYKYLTRNTSRKKVSLKF